MLCRVARGACLAVRAQSFGWTRFDVSLTVAATQIRLQGFRSLSANAPPLASRNTRSAGGGGPSQQQARAPNAARPPRPATGRRPGGGGGGRTGGAGGPSGTRGGAGAGSGGASAAASASSRPAPALPAAASTSPRPPLRSGPAAVARIAAEKRRAKEERAKGGNPMNDAIRAQTVRLVDPDGGKGLEVVLTADALELARSRGVDLVQVGLGVVRF